MSWRPPWQRASELDPILQQAAAEQTKQTTEMVQRLRDTRIAHGLSVIDVERDTRINRGYIDAIEEARFNELPAPVYARGFVRSYARYLGLDPAEAVEAMPRDLPTPLGLEPMPGLRRTAPPVLPSVNLPIAGLVGAAIVVVIIAVLVVPRLAGESGVDLPVNGSTPTVTDTSVDTGADTTETPAPPLAGATVPPFEDGTAPDLAGVSRAEAQQLLETLGVTPLIVEAFDDSPAGLIFDQSPSPGSPLREGDVMTLFISEGP